MTAVPVLYQPHLYCPTHETLPASSLRQMATAAAHEPLLAQLTSAVTLSDVGWTLVQLVHRYRTVLSRAYCGGGCVRDDTVLRDPHPSRAATAAAPTAVPSGLSAACPNCSSSSSRRTATTTDCERCRVGTFYLQLWNSVAPPSATATTPALVTHQRVTAVGTLVHARYPARDAVADYERAIETYRSTLTASVQLAKTARPLSALATPPPPPQRQPETKTKSANTTNRWLHTINKTAVAIHPNFPYEHVGGLVKWINDGDAIVRARPTVESMTSAWNTMLQSSFFATFSYTLPFYGTAAAKIVRPLPANTPMLLRKCEPESRARTCYHCVLCSRMAEAARWVVGADEYACDPRLGDRILLLFHSNPLSTLVSDDRAAAAAALRPCSPQLEAEYRQAESLATAAARVADTRTRNRIAKSLLSTLSASDTTTAATTAQRSILQQIQQLSAAAATADAAAATVGAKRKTNSPLTEMAEPSSHKRPRRADAATALDTLALASQIQSGDEDAEDRTAARRLGRDFTPQAHHLRKVHDTVEQQFVLDQKRISDHRAYARANRTRLQSCVTALTALAPRPLTMAGIITTYFGKQLVHTFARGPPFRLMDPKELDAVHFLCVEDLLCEHLATAHPQFVNVATADPSLRTLLQTCATWIGAVSGGDRSPARRKELSDLLVEMQRIITDGQHAFSFFVRCTLASMVHAATAAGARLQLLEPAIERQQCTFLLQLYDVCSTASYVASSGKTCRIPLDRLVLSSVGWMATTTLRAFAEHRLLPQLNDPALWVRAFSLPSASAAAAARWSPDEDLSFL